MGRKLVGVGLLVAAAVGGGAWGVRGGARVTRVAGVEWRNSLADAQAEARRTGRPILFLSMFGRLDEAMPCANARTLRATLFQDPEFRAFAEREAIPAWEMVRPVPKVTIDFGNGKQVVRTVRGNAVMYLLNADGKVFDVFPGVYTKADFLSAVRESIARMAKGDGTAALAYHRERSGVIPPTGITLGKSAVESPTLRLIGARTFGGFPVDPNAAPGDPAKSAFLLNASRLTDTSLTPMRPAEVLARVTTGTERRDEIPAAIIARDSETNLTRTRVVVHSYFASLKALPTPDEARDAVLGTILKIPYKDPTMGLDDILLPGTPR